MSDQWYTLAKNFIIVLAHIAEALGTPKVAKRSLHFRANTFRDQLIAELETKAK